MVRCVCDDASSDSGGDAAVTEDEVTAHDRDTAAVIVISGVRADGKVHRDTSDDHIEAEDMALRIGPFRVRVAFVAFVSATLSLFYFFFSSER